ncbi:hypothetical protein SMICM17S_02336 [Streptomyces microflavus]
MRSKRSTKHLSLIGMLLIAVAFAGLQLTAVTGRASPDTKNYLSYALSLSGESRAEAGRRAIDYSCASQQHGPLSSIPWTSRKISGESQEQCVRRLNDSVAHWSRNGNTSGMTAPFANHRFMAIFEARPGYPLFLVPFVTVFDATWGLWLAGLVVALAGSVCVLLTLRCAGASRRAGLAGQALYLALPTGTVAMNPLSDGLSLALGTAVVLGCTLLSLNRPRTGVALVVCGPGPDVPCALLAGAASRGRSHGRVRTPVGVAAPLPSAVGPDRGGGRTVRGPGRGRLRGRAPAVLAHRSGQRPGSADRPLPASRSAQPLAGIPRPGTDLLDGMAPPPGHLSRPPRPARALGLGTAGGVRRSCQSLWRRRPQASSTRRATRTWTSCSAIASSYSSGCSRS